VGRENIFQGTPMNAVWFQKDGAMSHNNNTELYSLYDVFEETVLTDWYPELFEEGYSWLQISMDLNPCDYFL
jgi:hypothetical protein